MSWSLFTPTTLVAKVRDLCKVSKECSASDLDDALRINEASKDLSKEKVKAMLKRWPDEPALWNYMNDGWSCRCNSTISINAGLEDFYGISLHPTAC